MTVQEKFETDDFSLGTKSLTPLTPPLFEHRQVSSLNILKAITHWKKHSLIAEKCCSFGGQRIMNERLNKLFSLQRFAENDVQ